MISFLEKNYKIFVVLMLGFMFFVSVLTAWHDGAIFDEKAHIPAGYSYLTQHDMRLNPEHPPLIKDLSGLPLIFMDLKFDLTKPFWVSDINGQWDAGNDLMWQEGNNVDKIIFLSRLPIVILSIILGLFIFRWVKELSGIVAGLLALTLYAFDPNILGHNHFVTTDLGIAAFVVFCFYYGIRFIKDPSWKNVAVAGIFLGLLHLTKFSSIMVLPILGLALAAYPLLMDPRKQSQSALTYKFKRLGEYLGKGVIIFAISIVLVWVVYAVNIYKMPQQKLADTIEFYFPHNDSSSTAVMTNKAAMTLNQSSITRPLSEYFLGMAMVFKRVEGGNGAYFMNEVSGKAFRSYFPTVFLIKEPIPTLFFMLLASIIAVWAYGKAIYLSSKEKLSDAVADFGQYIKRNITTLSMFGFIILYTYISITGNLNIGLRHLFPIFPFAYILTAVIVFDFFKKMENKGHRFLVGCILIVLPLLLISETAAVYPSYMSYFNSIAGGPKNGYNYVTDSNADWGQDIKRLKTYLNEHPEINKIRVNYFGGADVKYYLENRYIDWWDSKRPIEPGWYAISTNYLQGSIYDKQKKDSESYRWIRDNNVDPVHQVGTSIFIYYLTKDETIAINR